MDIEKWIKACESLRMHPYIDTSGKMTIGYGRNLTDDGINSIEADYLFYNDFYRSKRELLSLQWFSEQPENVRNALLNMNFNLGITRFLEFKEMIKALQEKDYTKAASEALNSDWAKEVGERAKDIAVMIRQG